MARVGTNAVQGCKDTRQESANIEMGEAPTPLLTS